MRNEETTYEIAIVIFCWRPFRKACLRKFRSIITNISLVLGRLEVHLKFSLSIRGA